MRKKEGGGGMNGRGPRKDGGGGDGDEGTREDGEERTPALTPISLPRGTSRFAL